MKRRVFAGGAFAGASLTGAYAQPPKRAIVGQGVYTGHTMEYWKKEA